MKRVLDLFLSISSLVVLAPIMAIIAVCIRVCMGGPVLFCQKRPGLNGEPFVILKFRTMRNPIEDDDQSSDKHRVTSMGRFLRRTSLDELPELVNVIKGEMSLVGPRPLLMEYLPRYSAEQARRHEVRPGITGWAQVCGRNNLSWEKRFELDVWYVDNQSFGLDLKILFKTIATVIHGRGAATAGASPETCFQGTPSKLGGPEITNGEGDTGGAA